MIHATPVQVEEPIVIHIDPVEAESVNQVDEEYNELQLINIGLCFLTIVTFPLIVCNFIIGSLQTDCNTKPRIKTLTISSYLVFTGIYQVTQILILFYMYNLHGVKKMSDFYKSFEGKVLYRVTDLFALVWYLLALIIFSTMSKKECMPYTYSYFEFLVIFTSILYGLQMLGRICGENI